jgi:type IV secretion system protein VirB10
MNITSPHKLEIKSNTKIGTNKKIKLLIFLIISISVSLVIYGIVLASSKQKIKVTNQESSNNKLEAATDFAKNLYQNQQDIRINKLDSATPPVISETRTISKIDSNNSNNSNNALKIELAKKLQEIRLQDLLKARSAKAASDGFTNMKIDNNNNNANNHSHTHSHSHNSYANSDNLSTLGSSNNNTNSSQDLASLQNMMSDQNKQMRKEKFLKEASNNDNTYLPSLLSDPISPYEVKAGGVIPAIMISGINSNLPGQIIAQVRENVYDSVSSNHLLIPQGTKLIGIYDSQIAYGQQRVLVVWNRLIMPNGSSMDLKGMTGSDQAGYGGFEDQVDHHYFRTFSSAIMMSMISTGATITSGKQATNNQNQQSAKDNMAANLANQLAQTSTSLINKNLNIQPEIKIRPGYLFNVMINRDLVLPAPYVF